ncbi:hypothetical protein VP01_19g2 [Puccinia sorghi]|uniref:Uncharacterized protein n=1 Tax=Puccinia sorghi TaxID=27349 RepID=A0A0L6VBJ1_9BASI|nr:hypothetical protein VP01_19g2 [Puccinia sorghi]
MKRRSETSEIPTTLFPAHSIFLNLHRTGEWVFSYQASREQRRGSPRDMILGVINFQAHQITFHQLKCVTNITEKMVSNSLPSNHFRQESKISMVLEPIRACTIDLGNLKKSFGLVFLTLRNHLKFIFPCEKKMHSLLHNSGWDHFFSKENQKSPGLLVKLNKKNNRIDPFKKQNGGYQMLPNPSLNKLLCEKLYLLRSRLVSILKCILDCVEFLAEEPESIFHKNIKSRLNRGIREGDQKTSEIPTDCIIRPIISSQYRKTPHLVKVFTKLLKASCNAALVWYLISSIEKKSSNPCTWAAWLTIQSLSMRWLKKLAGHRRASVPSDINLTCWQPCLWRSHTASLSKSLQLRFFCYKKFPQFILHLLIGFSSFFPTHKKKMNIFKVKFTQLLENQTWNPGILTDNSFYHYTSFSFISLLNYWFLNQTYCLTFSFPFFSSSPVFLWLLALNKPHRFLHLKKPGFLLRNLEWSSKYSYLTRFPLLTYPKEASSHLLQSLRNLLSFFYSLFILRNRFTLCSLAFWLAEVFLHSQQISSASHCTHIYEMRRAMLEGFDFISDMGLGAALVFIGRIGDCAARRVMKGLFATTDLAARSCFQAGKWSSLLRGLELGIENLYGLIRFEGKLLDKEKIWDIGVCGRSCGNLSEERQSSCHYDKAVSYQPKLYTCNMFDRKL